MSGDGATRLRRQPTIVELRKEFLRLDRQKVDTETGGDSYALLREDLKRDSIPESLKRKIAEAEVEESSVMDSGPRVTHCANLNPDRMRSARASVDQWI
jgi:hypothetical protein